MKLKFTLSILFAAFTTLSLNAQKITTSTVSVSENVYHVRHYVNDKLFAVGQINLNNQTASIVGTTFDGLTDLEYASGQGVIKCIEDVYSNHGWVSVWAWVQTAYIPATAAAIAVACANK